VFEKRDRVGDRIGDDDDNDDDDERLCREWRTWSFVLENVREIDVLTCLCASRVEEIEMMMR
jgi:hypothetical protein